ncbi:MAG: 50S ribosomal protein L10 [Dehalococcoidales bacterium]|nr:50S ribosomal protein L10 [Dehalococcoidales bacterium]
MKRAEKEKWIEEIQEAMTKCKSGIMTEYLGMKNADLTLLRRKLGESGIDYMVVKNTLARFAADNANKGFLKESLNGPMAIAFGYRDEVEPAKVLSEFMDASETRLQIKGGFIGDQLLTAEDVKTLATIPSREVLIAQVLGAMQGPISGFVNVCAAPMRGLVTVLQARADKLEGK